MPVASSSDTGRPGTAEAARGAGLALAQQVDDLILSRYGPPGVVVSERLEIVQFRGRTGPYLELPAGEPQTHVLRMARLRLRGPLRLALSQARRTSAPVRKARVEVDGSGRTCDIVVLPSQVPGHGDERAFVVLFEERASEQAKRQGTKPAERRRGGARQDPAAFLRLEEELASTKELLDSLLEEHDRANDELASANTELVSVNEELQSMNEELETAKEELQATNEELTTVNDELNGRNQELQLANADLVNLLETVESPRPALHAAGGRALEPDAGGRGEADRGRRARAPRARSGVLGRADHADRRDGGVGGPGSGRALAPDADPSSPRAGRPRRRHHHLARGHPRQHDVADAERERDDARNIVEAVQMPLVVIDGQLRVLSANEAFFTAFGVTAAEAGGAVSSTSAEAAGIPGSCAAPSARCSRRTRASAGSRSSATSREPAAGPCPSPRDR
jgi:two-component system CheB/CheR fusion protein